MRYSQNLSQNPDWDIDLRWIAPQRRRTTNLKLNIRSQATHDWIKPIITSVFVNQFAEHPGAGAAIESSPLGFSEGINSGRMVTIRENKVYDVTVLFPRVNAWFPTQSSMLTRKPMICCVYQRNI